MGNTSKPTGFLAALRAKPKRSPAIDKVRETLDPDETLVDYLFAERTVFGPDAIGTLAVTERRVLFRGVASMHVEAVTVPLDAIVSVTTRSSGTKHLVQIDTAGDRFTFRTPWGRFLEDFAAHLQR
ncbi:hypothetical protein [Curtobacterium oceanosedimentum]|uniref:hypothetical protein n=1 Tax=Curtobacterium oceanosedimentum TaxID=465820 RepID=UPI0033922F11